MFLNFFVFSNYLVYFSHTYLKFTWCQFIFFASITGSNDISLVVHQAVFKPHGKHVKCDRLRSTLRHRSGWGKLTDLHNCNINIYKLQYTCQHNLPSTAELLITSGNADYQMRHPPTGKVPLHEAAQRGHIECIKVTNCFNLKLQIILFSLDVIR